MLEPAATNGRSCGTRSRPTCYFETLRAAALGGCTRRGGPGYPYRAGDGSCARRPQLERPWQCPCRPGKEHSGVVLLRVRPPGSGTDPLVGLDRALEVARSRPSAPSSTPTDGRTPSVSVCAPGESETRDGTRFVQGVPT